MGCRVAPTPKNLAPRRLRLTIALWALLHYPAPFTASPDGSVDNQSNLGVGGSWTLVGLSLALSRPAMIRAWVRHPPRKPTTPTTTTPEVQPWWRHGDWGALRKKEGSTSKARAARTTDRESRGQARGNQLPNWKRTPHNAGAIVLRRANNTEAKGLLPKRGCDLRMPPMHRQSGAEHSCSPTHVAESDNAPHHGGFSGPVFKHRCRRRLPLQV